MVQAAQGGAIHLVCTLLQDIVLAEVSVLAPQPPAVIVAEGVEIHVPPDVSKVVQTDVRAPVILHAKTAVPPDVRALVIQHVRVLAIRGVQGHVILDVKAPVKKVVLLVKVIVLVLVWGHAQV